MGQNVGMVSVTVLSLIEYSIVIGDSFGLISTVVMSYPISVGMTFPVEEECVKKSERSLN